MYFISFARQSLKFILRTRKSLSVFYLFNAALYVKGNIEKYPTKYVQATHRIKQSFISVNLKGIFMIPFHKQIRFTESPVIPRYFDLNTISHRWIFPSVVSHIDYFDRGEMIIRSISPRLYNLIELWMHVPDHRCL